MLDFLKDVGILFLYALGGFIGRAILGYYDFIFLFGEFQGNETQANNCATMAQYFIVGFAVLGCIGLSFYAWRYSIKPRREKREWSRGLNRARSDKDSD